MGRERKILMHEKKIYELSMYCVCRKREGKCDCYEVECKVFGVGCLVVCDACDCKIMKVEWMR